jgi:hypothetical protein
VDDFVTDRRSLEHGPGRLKPLIAEANQLLSFNYQAIQAIWLEMRGGGADQIGDDRSPVETHY